MSKQTGRTLMILEEGKVRAKADLRDALKRILETDPKLPEPLRHQIINSLAQITTTAASIADTWDIRKTRIYWTCKGLYFRATGKEWVDAE